MGEERRWEMDGWRGERGNCISDVKIIIIVIIRKNNWHYKQFFIVYGGGDQEFKASLCYTENLRLSWAA